MEMLGQQRDFATGELVEETDSIRRKLFHYVMEDDWNKVVDIYESEQTAYNAKITKSGDTALHIAVNDGREDTVEKLVDMVVSKQREKQALGAANEQGNTPLHLAASLGNVKMCGHIASKDPTLLGQRNVDNETPFFLAAVHGKKDAFLCLHGIMGGDRNKGLSYGRRNDGQTILHVTIAGEYFDLAYQIIHIYEEMVNYVDLQGISPLHLLASKPSIFRSGSHLSGCKKLIYHCTFVDELTVEEPPATKEQEAAASENIINIRYPENYETCMNFLWLLKKAIVVVTKNKNAKIQRKDLENQQGKRLFPPNYATCFDILKFMSKAMLIILGLGSKEIRKLEDKKKKHKWSRQIMDELLRRTSMYEYDQYMGRNNLLSSTAEETKPYDIGDSGDVAFSTHMEPHDYKEKIKDEQGVGEKGKSNLVVEKRETPILRAAKNGITEMVEEILNKFPVAIHDMNWERKNIVLLAVENRQPHVYQLLLSEKRNIMKESIFRKVDNEGNSALHLAATLGDFKPWNIPGAALQMQWEIKWYEYVKTSMPPQFFVRHNKKGKTPRDIFTKKHKELVEKGEEWLTNTSESCSVVAALIATVAFATSATVPGGVNENSGSPILEKQSAFKVFAISSLIALCFSVTAVVMFLAILTSRYQEKDFGKDLPMKLLVGLSSLFVSIASMLVSFCAGHFFVLRDELEYAAFPVYAVTCLPVTFFAIAQFPLYVDLVWATFKKVPQRSYMAVP